MKILIATDNSPESRATVEQYLTAPIAPDTEIRIVSAYARSSPMMATESMGLLREYDAERDREAYRSASDAADHAATLVEAKRTGFRIMKAVLDGTPEHVILSEAATFGADLIVVGANSHGSVDRLLMGAVSREVAMHAKCSVEIVRIKNK
jgi:nucleotide-binding universal stress UspA family protein